MEYIQAHRDSIKIYGYVVGFYLFMAFLGLYPSMHQNAVAQQVQQQLTISQKKPTVTPTPVEVSGRPQTFSIDRLNISFPVASGAYNANNQKWSLDSNHVFVNTVGNPNPEISTSSSRQPNVAVFYGHNFMNVVGNTKNLVAGDVLTIKTDNGYAFRYYYVRDEVVNPTDTTVLGKTDRSTPVALITCTGVWDQVRRIMYFAPLGSPQQLVQPAKVSTL